MYTCVTGVFEKVIPWEKKHNDFHQATLIKMDSNNVQDNSEVNEVKNENEKNIEPVAGTSSAAPLSHQMALEYTQSILKNASQRDGKILPLLLPPVASVSNGGCATSEPTSPASLSPSTDKTDNSHPEAPDMRRELDRLKTFDRWPLSFITPEQLASNGFYYLGRNDEVRCAFCKVEIMRWEYGDDPAVDHQRWAPQCPFLRRRPTVDNVPLAAGTGRDECGVRAPPVATDSVPMLGPRHPRYASEAARLRTFSEWPRSMRQKPEELAEAGFFYTGEGDKTKCFFCDGGLKDWEDDDVPWEQHARWFDRCAYVQLVKGREYVQKVMSQAAVVPAPKEQKEPKEEPKKEEVKERPASPASPADAAEDLKLCKICFAEERNVCFVPCGHVVACAKCALATNRCPMCRRAFTSAVRLYFS